MISDGQWDSVFGLGFGRLQGGFSADVVDTFQSISDDRVWIVAFGKKSDEFSAKFDTEQFFRRVQLKAFFMTNKTLETQKKTNSNPSPNANLIGLHPKANLVPSTFSLENAGTIFEDLISAKRSNSPISMPMSGRHSNHFAVVRT